MATLDDLTKIWKSSLPQNHKQKLFRATVETILLYGSTIWTLTKAPEASQDGTYTRMLRAVLNISWKKHPIKSQQYGHLRLISGRLKERRFCSAGHCCRSKNELVSSLILWTPNHGSSVGRPSRTFINQLEEVIGCYHYDLPVVMADRDGEHISPVLKVIFLLGIPASVL